MDKKYFDVLMESLEDAAAFSKGDASRARVVKFAPPHKASLPRSLGVQKCKVYPAHVIKKTNRAYSIVASSSKRKKRLSK